MANIIEKTVKYWYIPLIIGILFTIVGIWVFFTPLASYITLSLLFSISFIVAGIMEIFYSISNRKTLGYWGAFLAGGILNLLVGVLLISSLEMSMTILAFYIGFWLLFRSIMAISTSFELKRDQSIDWGYLFVLGILGVLFSFMLLWNPLFAGLTIVYWTAFALVAIGIFHIWFAVKLNKLKRFDNRI